MDEAWPALKLVMLLAKLFYYNITQGGFAQLLFNLQGAYLAEIEEMLVAANAPVAREYYVKAIEECLNNQPAYQQFLNRTTPLPAN